MTVDHLESPERDQNSLSSQEHNDSLKEAREENTDNSQESDVEDLERDSSSVQNNQENVLPSDINQSLQSIDEEQKESENIHKNKIFSEEIMTAIPPSEIPVDIQEEEKEIASSSTLDTGNEIREAEDALITEEEIFSSPLKQYHILIDPGHGGGDSGAVVGSVYEKDLNGKIAYYLGRFLTELGQQITFSRDPGNSRVELPLDKRVDRINSVNPDLIISIHHNANYNPQPRGYSIFWSSYRPWSDRNDIFVKRGGLYYPWVKEEIRNNMTYMYYLDGESQIEITGDEAYSVVDRSPGLIAQNSLKLALMIHDNMLNLHHISPQVVSGQSRAVIDMENRVLRLNKHTAVLVECGFMTNPEELQQLVLEQNQRDTAKAIAKGILDYLKQL